MLHRCFPQTYNLRDGLKEFGGNPGKEGYEAAFKEAKQLHGRDGLKPIRRQLLSHEEAKRALEAVTIVLRKRAGLVKSRTCADGRKEKLWLNKEDISSPTASAESVLLTSVVEALEE